MRIVLTAYSLAPSGGGEMSIFQLSRELSQRGHSIDVFFQNDGVLRSDYEMFCRSVRPARTDFRRNRWLRDLNAIAPTVWAGVRQKPDVVYVHVFGDIVCGALIARLARSPLVCHLRGHEQHSHDSIRRASAWVNRFIAVSQATREQWVGDGLDAEKVEVVYNGVDPREYPAGGEEERRSARDALGLPPEAFVALYYGRLDEGKGLEVLLEAWRRLALTPAEAQLILLGDPILASDPDRYRDHLHRFAPPGCLWLPARRDVIGPLHASDVVVLPSFGEGFSRVVIEAMSTGRPVIASRVGGVPEVLDGPFERFLLEPGDPAKLAELLASMINWRTREPKLAEICSSHVRERFCLERTVNGVERILREVVNRHKR